MIQLFLLLFPHYVSNFPTQDFFRGRFTVEPPHCARTPFVLGHISSVSSADVIKTMQLQFYIGLHTTVCFRLNEDDHQNNSKSSWLHTIRLDSLEHHHPVVQHYEFAIPEVKTDCFCECDFSSDSCSPKTHQYMTCPLGLNDTPATSCYGTFFPNQASDGCPSGSNPKMCCNLKFSPYQNKTYMAVKIDQPTTFATFVYTAYDYSQSKWIEKDKSTIRLQLDGGTQDRFLDHLRRISLAVTAGGRASHQLESGMYYANSNPGGEMGELRRQPLNEFAENNFDRLGWYRYQNGRFVVNNGQVRLQDIHKAKVKNCKEQTYYSVLSAHYFIPDSFNLTRPLEMQYPWIQSAKIYDGTNRQVVVNHAEGTNLHITLQGGTHFWKDKNLAVTGDEDGHQLMFFHNQSKIDDFSGTIVVDSRSNRYFNLTVYGASGKINGIVKYSVDEDSDDIYSFSTYVHDLQAANRSMIVPLHSVVEAGSRMICLRADEEHEESQICKVVNYHEIPLEIDLDQNTWHEQIGFCPGCNQDLGLSSFTRYLNPQNWINGINSVSGSVHTGISVICYAFILFCLFQIIKMFSNFFTFCTGITSCLTDFLRFLGSCFTPKKKEEEEKTKKTNLRRREDDDEGVYV